MDKQTSDSKANVERQLIQGSELCKKKRDVCVVWLTSPSMAGSVRVRNRVRDTCATVPFPHAPVVRTRGGHVLLTALSCGGRQTTPPELQIHTFSIYSHKFTAERFRSLKSKLCDVALLFQIFFCLLSASLLTAL